MPASLSTWWFYLPLLDRSAARAIDAIDDHVGKSLCDVAAGIREVDENADRIPGRVKRTDEIDQETDLAWGSVRQARESVADTRSMVASCRPRTSSLHWPEYGGLIVDLCNIVTSMDEVARSNPVRVERGRPLLRG